MYAVAFRMESSDESTVAPITEQNNRECHIPPSLTITFEQLRGVKRALAHVVGVTYGSCCRFRRPSNKGESVNF